MKFPLYMFYSFYFYTLLFFHKHHGYLHVFELDNHRALPWPCWNLDHYFDLPHRHIRNYSLSPFLLGVPKLPLLIPQPFQRFYGTTEIIHISDFTTLDESKLFEDIILSLVKYYLQLSIIEQTTTGVETAYKGYDSKCVNLTLENPRHCVSVRLYGISIPCGSCNFAENQLLNFQQNRKDRMD